MAKPVVVTIEHGSSNAAVKAKLRDSMEEIRGRLGPFVGAIEQEWAGAALQFRSAALGQPVTGRIDGVNAWCASRWAPPGLLGYLGDMIASRVQREGALLLDKK